MSDLKNLSVNCPTCKKEFNYYSSENRPFCTDRCKMIDAGHWLEETYTVKGRDNSVYIENPEALEQLLEESHEIY